MKTYNISQKIRSVKLCLQAHPDNEIGSEFEDRINDLIDIESNIVNLSEQLCQHPFKKVVKNNNGVNYCSKCDRCI